jgi:hypothetical protein
MVSVCVEVEVEIWKRRRMGMRVGGRVYKDMAERYICEI